VLFKFKIEVDDSNQRDYYGYKSLTKSILEAESEISDSITENLLFRRGYNLKEFEPILHQLDSSGYEDSSMLKLNIWPMGILDFYYLDSFTNDPGNWASYYMFDILRGINSSNPKNESFIKSSYWFTKASNSSITSEIIIKLATSLECLIEPEQICKICQRPVFSIIYRLKRLIERYCESILSNDPELVKTIEKFYDFRSKMIHGSELPFTDIPNQRSFDPIINRITGNTGYYLFIARITILNWYVEKHYDEEIRRLKRYEWYGERMSISFRSDT